jgi:uncharacterized protein (TIGR00297 family)
MGLMVCFLIAQMPGIDSGLTPLLLRRPALSALVTLVALTTAATRFGRSKKELRGLAEHSSGRRTSQVAANLGVAALFAALGRYEGLIAALAEATADALSSEIGQAVGGATVLFPTLLPVTPGTDGGMSLAGTTAGLLGAAIVVTIGSLQHSLWPNAVIVMISACTGFLFDSFLGATAERKGWIGNDVVNLASTFVAACLAEALKLQ